MGLSLARFVPILASMDPDSLDQRLTVALAFYPLSIRRDLLRILDLPDEERVREIGGLYQTGINPGLVELLMDIEEDPRIRRLMAAELRGIIRRAG
jgi:hypothetical protein